MTNPFTAVVRAVRVKWLQFKQEWDATPLPLNCRPTRRDPNPNTTCRVPVCTKARVINGFCQGCYDAFE